MIELLRRRNVEMLRRLERLRSAISTCSISELEPYRKRLCDFCDYIANHVLQNIADLDSGGQLLVEDVLSNTLSAARFTRLLSARLTAPILRARPTDRLTLRILGWLHRQHPKTVMFPAAFTSGETGVLPMTSIMPIYSLPAFEQETLLFQPLLFHEFGHLLYQCHAAEMDDLVSDLQQDLDQLLVPPSQRNDQHGEVQAAQRRVIVTRWHTWANEIFCDAVGLVIGGPSFLYAFSEHLSTMGRGDFYRPYQDLCDAEHPVTWLRIQLLASRARRLQWKDAADQVDATWAELAQAMEINEDYHGFYDDRFRLSIDARVDEMLTEAAPRGCSQQEAACDPDSIVGLLNSAWRQFRANPETYAAWVRLKESKRSSLQRSAISSHFLGWRCARSVSGASVIQSCCVGERDP